MDETAAVARRGGRPSADAAARLGPHIIAVATRLFLADGFEATSIEAVAAAAGISKRTFYHRFRDKPDLFRAVVRGLIARWTPPADEDGLALGGPLEETLRRSGRQILAAALSPEALALYRLLIAEAPRFPELAQIINEQGTNAGIARLGAYLEAEARAGRLVLADCRFAAEQFLNMILAAPRRRALGMGPPMSEAERERWIDRTVALFLDGCRRAGR